MLKKRRVHATIIIIVIILLVIQGILKTEKMTFYIWRRTGQLSSKIVTLYPGGFLVVKNETDNANMTAGLTRKVTFVSFAKLLDAKFIQITKNDYKKIVDLIDYAKQHCGSYKLITSESPDDIFILNTKGVVYLHPIPYNKLSYGDITEKLYSVLQSYVDE